MVGSHIDDFCICGTNHACLDEFRFTMLDPAKGGFAGTYEGPLYHYLGCAITRDLNASTTSLSQVQYIEHACQKYGQWNVTPPKTLMMPDTRPTVDDCPEPALHPGSQLLSTLISLLAPLTSTTTSLALYFSLHSPPSPLSPPLLLVLLLLVSPSRNFHYHNHLFPLLVVVL